MFWEYTVKNELNFLWRVILQENTGFSETIVIMIFINDCTITDKFQLMQETKRKPAFATKEAEC